MAVMACGSRSPAPPARAAEPGAPGVLLERLVEKYWDDNAALSPWYAWGGAGSVEPQYLADSLALERRYLAEIAAVPRAQLDAESILTYDIFTRERTLAVEGFTYPRELLPVNPYDCLPLDFAVLGLPSERLARSSVKDYESWRRLAQRFASWTDQAILNMRDGMRRGYALPRILVEEMLPQLAALGADTSANVFYRALEEAPGAVADGERQRSSPAVAATIKDTVLPAYRALHDFLERDYLPRARGTVGLSALPLGQAWYAFLAKRATGGPQTPAQLHALGIAEVERLHQRATALLVETAFAGDLPSFYERLHVDPRFSYRDGAELLRAYEALKATVTAALPAVLSKAPQADFAIRAAGAERGAATPALAYHPRTPNGSMAAVLDVDTAHLEARPALLMPAQFLEEGVPGRHTQAELQRERADLPRFRRFGGAPAFVEGWSLYAATLGEELGLYPEPEARFAALVAQMRCAAGLVIDTGIHAQAWTRQQALDYVRGQVPMESGAAADMVDRVIALPGEALACGSGFLTLQALRTRTLQSLGARFDAREFHGELLRDGAIPLDLLESRIRLWAVAVAQRVAEAPASSADPASSAWR